MSPAEQDQHFGKLLVEERSVRKTIACLASKSRQAHETQEAVLEALKNPWNIDFSQVRKHYNLVADVDVKGLIDELELQVKRHTRVRGEIEQIEETGV